MNTGRGRRILSALPRWVLGAIAVVVVSLLLVVAWYLWRFLRDFFSAVDLLAGRYGINSWLAKAIALLLTGPLPYGVKHGFFVPSKDGNRKHIVRLATGVYACCFFLGMWAVDRTAFVDRTTGEVLKWYAIDSEGTIAMYDGPGHDTRTGQKLERVTEEIRIAYVRQQDGVVPAEIAAAKVLAVGAFDPNTGRPRFWCARRATGPPILFDGPGFDPFGSGRLEPITPAIVSELEAWSRSVREQSVAEAESRARKSEARDAAAAQVAREREIDRYIDRAARLNSSVALTLAVHVLPADGFATDAVEASLREAVAADGKTVIPLFRSAFSRDGLDRDLFAGNPSLARDLGLSDYCGGVLLARLSEIRPPTWTGAYFLSEVGVHLRTVDSTSGRITASLETSAKGGGADRAAARANAVRELSSSLAVEAGRVLQ